MRRWIVSPRGPALGGMAFVVAVLAMGVGSSSAQLVNQAVGGVSVDTAGILQNATLDEIGALARLRGQALQQVPNQLRGKVAMRKVSLRKLDEALAQAEEQIPDALKYLAGLQRVEFVFVYPQQQDIVLVGPGEGWRADAKGNMIGLTTGRPVMLLDDLLVALRSARQASQEAISCSINPTKDGLARLQSLKPASDARSAATAMEQALGLQEISVTGVPPTSHFARVLVAADYRMKRIGMALDPSPVHGLPSYLQMVSTSGRTSTMTPRWWLEPQYDAIVRDPDGLAWQLRGSAVKTMTEEDHLAAGGSLQHSGKAGTVAQKWADLMTQKYGELCVADPVFGELQNCMDLAVVAALVIKERLPEKAGCSLPRVLDNSSVKTEEYPAAKNCSTVASALKKGRTWILSASGGVMINSWAIAQSAKTDGGPAEARAKAAPGEKTSWWWN